MDSNRSIKICVNRLCTNVRLTICAQMSHCTNSAQEHLLIDISVNSLCTNGQQTVDRNICQPFDICNSFAVYHQTSKKKHSTQEHQKYKENVGLLLYKTQNISVQKDPLLYLHHDRNVRYIPSLYTYVHLPIWRTLLEVPS